MQVPEIALQIDRHNYRYHPFYCEENIWYLCQQPEFVNSEVIVIAALGECFPILYQRAASAPDAYLLWDYHVVLLWHATSDTDYILDFDTTLPFCTEANSYFQRSFLHEKHVTAEFIPLFRLMSAQDYIAKLLSDRRHMKTKRGWSFLPPSWSAISASESNLAKFTDMTDHEYGQVMTLAQLRKNLQPISA